MKLTRLKSSIPMLHATRGGWADQRRGTSTERGYGWAWSKLRDQVLARDCGLCQPCQRRGRVTLARAVDHIVNKAQGGTDNPANLQAICDQCHKAKTAAEARGAEWDGLPLAHP